jgi:hypothetical protein
MPDRENSKMEMQLIQKLAVGVSLDHPKEDDGKEIKAP